jgi:hypothetical protein
MALKVSPYGSRGPEVQNCFLVFCFAICDVIFAVDGPLGRFSS